MSDIFSDTIPCEDCEEQRQYLSMKYEVLDCKPDASQPGACVVRYRRKDAAAAGLLAGVQTQLSAAAFQATPAAPQLAGTLLPLQVATAKAIVNVFETGEVLGDYSAVTVLPGDTGHLSYGRSQTSLASGNLALLVEMYCDEHGARFAPRLQAWLPRLRGRDVGLDADEKLQNVLRACADDPVMRDVQDRFFDEAYWNRALRAAVAQGITLPLGVAIVYDSWVHGSWAAMRDRTEAAGALRTTGEKNWLERYVRTRRDWLATHSNPLLRNTVYRMDAFQRLIEQGYWGLPLPLAVRGQEISVASLSAQPPGCYDGPQPGTRAVAVQSPFLRGLDVRLLQLGLSDRDYQVRADGIYGKTSAGLVKAFQQKQGLPVTGVADLATISLLVA